MPLVYGENTHPALLTLGLPLNAPQYAEVAAVAGELHPLEDVEQLATFDLREWDALVVVGSPVPRTAAIHVLALGTTSLGMGGVFGGNGGIPLRFGTPTRSMRMSVPDELPAALRRLVVDELVPWLKTGARRLIEADVGAAGSAALGVLAATQRVPVTPSRLQQPFVVDGNGAALAGAFNRVDGIHGGRTCWALPYLPDQLGPWLAAAFAAWLELTPERFPSSAWRARRPWLTAQERTLDDELEDLSREREAVLRDLDQRETDLARSRNVAAAAADGGDRRLLTTQGEELVAGVMDVLRRVGFGVLDSDVAADASDEQRLQDLLITVPGLADWTALVEVKGYSRSTGKTNDLTKIERAVSRYRSKHGRRPSAVWYVVNPSYDEDPSTRGKVLASAAEDVADFEEHDGLVIDTRDLFQAVNNVHSNAVDFTPVRLSLVKGRGRWSPPADAERTGDGEA